MKQQSYILKSNFILAVLVSISVLVSCDSTTVNGVFIDHTLYENLPIAKRFELKKLIKETLNKDEKALAKLNEFSCGGAAGCYDLGFVITQIIYKISENEFIEMVKKLEKEKIIGLEGLIEAGLEYGDNNHDGKMDNKKIEIESPKLYKVLSDKHNSK